MDKYMMNTTDLDMSNDDLNKLSSEDLIKLYEKTVQHYTKHVCEADRLKNYNNNIIHIMQSKNNIEIINDDNNDISIDKKLEKLANDDSDEEIINKLKKKSTQIVKTDDEIDTDSDNYKEVEIKKNKIDSKTQIKSTTKKN